MTLIGHPAFVQNHTQPKINFGEPIPNRRALKEIKKTGNYKKAGAVATLTLVALAIPAAIYKNSFSADPQNPSDSTDFKTRTTSPIEPKEEPVSSDTISTPTPPKDEMDLTSPPSIEEQSYAVYLIGGAILLGSLVFLGIKKYRGTSKENSDSVPVTKTQPRIPTKQPNAAPQQNAGNLLEKPVETPFIATPPYTPPTTPKKSQKPDSPIDPKGKKFDANEAAKNYGNIRSNLRRTDSPPSSPSKFFDSPQSKQDELAGKFSKIKSGTGLRRTDSPPRTDYLNSPTPNHKVVLKETLLGPFKELQSGSDLENLLHSYKNKHDEFVKHIKEFNESFWCVITDPKYKQNVCQAITKDQVKKIVEVTMEDILINFTKYPKESKDPRLVNLEQLTLVLTHNPEAKDLQDKYLELAKCGHTQFNYSELSKHAAAARTNMKKFETEKQAAIQEFNKKMDIKKAENEKFLANSPSSPKKEEYSQRHLSKVIAPQKTVEQDVIVKSWTEIELNEFINTNLKFGENHSTSFLSMDPSSLERFAQLLIKSNAEINLKRYWEIEKTEITSESEISARNQRLRVILPLLSDELMEYTASQESFWCMVQKQGHATTILNTFAFDSESQKKQLDKLKRIVSGMCSGDFKNRITFICTLIQASQHTQATTEEKFKKLNAIKEEFERIKLELEQKKDKTDFNILRLHSSTILTALKTQMDPLAIQLRFNQQMEALSIEDN